MPQEFLIAVARARIQANKASLTCLSWPLMTMTALRFPAKVVAGRDHATHLPTGADLREKLISGRFTSITW